MIEKIEHLERKLEIINADVTNHCNARCFFCFNDWDAFTPHNMTVETFKNLLKLLPLMGGTDFLVSCWFEPTINPAFYDMLDLLPAEYKDRVYFTTNLVTKIKDEDMERMCRSNVDHINVSLETWDEDEYVSITGVKNTHFFENVERLGFYSRKYGTDLHVITMLTRRNAAHFKELVQRVHDTLSPSLHEIRTPYFFIEDTGTKEALIEDMLTRKEIDQIQSDVNALGYTDILWDVRFSKEKFEGLEKDPSPHKEASSKVYYRLRVNSDGTARLGHQKTGKLIDINEPGDVVEKIRAEIFALQLEEVRMYELAADDKKFRRSKTEKPFCIDRICIYDDRFLYIRGWDLSAAYPVKHGLQRVAVMESGRKKVVLKLRKEYRTDLAENLGSKESGNAGFSVLFDLNGFEDADFTISTGFIEDDTVVLMRRIYGEDNSVKHRIREKVRKITGRP